MAIQVEVKPKDKTFIGWDVHIISWKVHLSGITIHKITWTEDSEKDGVFVGTTGDLPPGTYGVRAELFGPGREIELTILGKPAIVQPAGSTWPMKVKVNAATQNQNSDTLYVEVTK
jgi:hypothetical protein